MTDRIQVWSSGGGTQSAAIAALICKGELRPDISVIVDTEREVQQTWDYHDSVIVPALAKVGVTLHRVPKSKYATVDLYGGKDGDALLIPAFTNKKGKLPTYCSNEWKSRVVQRFCRDMLPEAEAFTLWLGISRDEFNRMRGEGGEGKWTYWHPLIAKMMNRHDCVSLVKSMGWPPPPGPVVGCVQIRDRRNGLTWTKTTPLMLPRQRLLRLKYRLKTPMCTCVTHWQKTEIVCQDFVLHKG